jgi:GT2 family glycosyltransferase
MLTLSLVIPTAGRPDAARALIAALRRQSRPPDELLVVEQGDAPDSALRAAVEAIPGGRHIHSTLRSLPHARNLGVLHSRGDVILFIDDDVEPSDDLVHHHLAAHEDASVAGVGGRVTGGYDAGDAEVAQRVGVYRPLTGGVIRNFHSLWAQDTDHLPGGNMSFKRQAFIEAGPFEEAFGGAASLWEETDFCLRVRERGLRLRYEPRASLVHRPHPSGGCREDRFADWLRWHAHNSMLYACRHLAAAPRLLFTAGRLIRFAGFAIEHRRAGLIATGIRGLCAGRATHRRLRAGAGASPALHPLSDPPNAVGSPPCARSSPSPS